MIHAATERRDHREAGLPPYRPSEPPPQTPRAPKTSPRNHDGLHIVVVDGNVDGALRLLKRRAGSMLRDLRDRESYTKPGERKREKRLAAIRRMKTRAARARRHERG
jgi:ribosomal protein S21